ncbi:MAG: CarD family transcriptional regulator, partial [Elusimicrobiota bacterium]|nr:CarD family transcriptional regulator [Elusimicrobiota bacterium]
MNIWKNTKEFANIENRLSPGKSLTVSGLNTSASASLAGALSQAKNRDTFIVLPKESSIEQWQDNLSNFTGYDIYPFPLDYPSRRIEAAKNLSGSRPVIILGSRAAFEEKIISPQKFNDTVMKVKSGKTSYDSLLDKLTAGYYVRNTVVPEEGDFARRGNVIDFWPPGREKPVRALFSGDKAGSLKEFDPRTQRSLKEIGEAEVLPVSFDRTGKDTSYIGEYSTGGVLVIEVDGEKEKLNKEKIFGEDKPLHINFSDFIKADFNFHCRPFSFPGGLKQIKSELSALKETGYKFYFAAPTAGELRKGKEIIREAARMDARQIKGYLHEGFSLQELKTAVISIGDLFYHHKRFSRPPPAYNIAEVSDFKDGDYVVHKHFGIGKFRGLSDAGSGGGANDYLKLEYQHGAKIYVAAESASMVHKYSGRRAGIKVDSLTGTNWNEKVRKVRDSVKVFSSKLLQIYRGRRESGYSFKPHDELEKEFADIFPYELTEHQKAAVKEVLKDMESGKAMDRLVCGDVGFGKTEVAMRAAFRAVLNGKQVIFLAPTTVLCRQHFHTLLERFSE